MTSHRTTARGALLLLFALAFAGGTTAARATNDPPRRLPQTTQLVFPVVGPVVYSDDFGDPRGQGRHEGNDLVAARKAPAVAAEGGTVTFWTTSRSAGCMLYLHGDSGTTYLYIHLNNDLTNGNDNRGQCRPGVAYAKGLVDGARVEAGQLVGYVGDSGDANGIHPHLHFEVHPHGGAAVDPYPFLRRAQHLLLSAPFGTTFRLALEGTLVSTSNGMLRILVSRVTSQPARRTAGKPEQSVLLTVPANVLVQRGPSGSVPVDGPSALRTASPGARVSVTTAPAVAALATLAGKDGALAASRVVLQDA